MKECTFKPQIKHYRHMSQNAGSFYERSQVWNENREKHISQERDHLRYDEDKTCSFKPQINLNSRIMAGDKDLFEKFGQEKVHAR